MDNALKNIIYKYKCYIAPVLAFICIFAGYLFQNNEILKYLGAGGCIAASFILAFIAVNLPKKDIVSILVPVYAILIFNPWGDFYTGLFMQILYAVTILVVAYRLDKRFNT